MSHQYDHTCDCQGCLAEFEQITRGEGEPTQADDGGERESVEKRINSFGALRQDWDTYGAPPIPGKVMLLALDLVGFLEGTKLEITWASPTNDEAILLDTKNGMGIEVSAHGN